MRYTTAGQQQLFEENGRRTMHITRDIIRKDITYEGSNYSEICSHINRWKNLFRSKGAKKDNLVALAILEMNINHISAIFAIAEMGMKLLVIDKPVTEQTLHMTKMAIFGPVDFALECDVARNSPLHHEMVMAYSKHVIHESEYDSFLDDAESDIECKPTDQFLLASTSGTTSRSKPIWFTHEEIYKISQRNIEVFKFESESRVLHTRNMHHASSLLTFLLPALMKSKNHYFAYMFANPTSFLSICEEEIIPHKIDRLLCGNMFDVAKLIESLNNVGGSIPNKILINISGFTVTKVLVDYVKKYNIEFMSHYGSIDTGIPLLLNHITTDYVFEPSRLGVQPDDFYTMETHDGFTEITCSMWDSSRIIQDNLEKRDGAWYYGGRLDRDPIENFVSSITSEYTFVIIDDSRHLVLWEEIDSSKFDNLAIADIHYLDKETFTVDTKINMDQLREYLRCTHGR
jgi:hypothetical protein